MNYFKLYEAERRTFRIGAKFIEKYERYPLLVKIIDVRDGGLVRYKYMHTGHRFYRSKDSFLHNFKPYNET